MNTPNTGHGHVYPRPDGYLARCGGPKICKECAFDFARKYGDNATEQLETPVSIDPPRFRIKGGTPFQRETLEKAFEAFLHSQGFVTAYTTEKKGVMIVRGSSDRWDELKAWKP